jgi:hypothetical protein
MTNTLSVESRARLADGILSNGRVNGLTHNFYRYPARFSPDFVRAILKEYSKPGDLIYDPFMGGGTTLVEAAALGRDCIGTDISSLAAFISQVKTATYTETQLANVEAWISVVVPMLTVVTDVPASAEWIRKDYQRNINDKDTWRIRKLLEIALDAVDLLDTSNERKLARCMLLKTGQWALDCRAEIPSTSLFQQQIQVNGSEIIGAAREFSETMRQHRPKPKVLCLHRSAIGVEDEKRFRMIGIPKLILTSPPYPGLHVLYHRWQVRGRRETAAPFWIAGTLDGDGASFYTFGDRKQSGLEKYFETVRLAFRSIHALCDDSTMVVQMVAFAEPESQLPRYLDAMSEAGFREQKVSISSGDAEGRMWRCVPGRKWYASQMGATGGSREVVLFHKKR